MRWRSASPASACARARRSLEWVAAEAFSAISIDPVFAEMLDEPPARRQPDASSSLERKTCPELRDAHRTGWVAWAERVTVRRLEEDVERALLLRAGHHFAWQRCKFDPERAQDPIPPGERQMCAPDVDFRTLRTGGWQLLGGRPSRQRGRRLAGGIPAQPLRRVRLVPRGTDGGGAGSDTGAALAAAQHLISASRIASAAPGAAPPTGVERGDLAQETRAHSPFMILRSSVRHVR